MQTCLHAHSTKAKNVKQAKDWKKRCWKEMQSLWLLLLIKAEIFLTIGHL